MRLFSLVNWGDGQHRWGGPGSDLARGGPGRGGNVGESAEEGVEGGVSSSTAARSSSVSGMEASMRCRLSLASSSWALARALRGVEVAAGAGHPVRALLEEAVGAVAVAQVVVLPGLARGRGAGGDRVAVDEHLDGAHVAGEVAGVGVGPGQRVRGDLGVVLGGVRGAVSEPGLQLEQGHRLLGVVELAGDGRPGAVAGDVAADVGGRDAGLAAQRGDDRAVDVVLRDRLRAHGEQQVDLLAGLAVKPGGLRGAHRLPGVDGLAEQRVDRLGERGPGLVDRHVEQADGIVGQDVGGVAGDRDAVALPADGPDPQAGDLVAAQPGEQPGQRDRADQLHRVVGACGGAGQVGVGQVQPGPQQLRPDVVGDHSRVGADQCCDAARHDQRAGRVEAAGEPLPFLAVAEERAGGHEDVRLGARGDRGAGAGPETVVALDVVTDPHPVHRGDPGGAGLAGPLPRLGDLRVLGGQPPSGLGEDAADDGAHLRAERRGGVPAFDPPGPGRVRADDLRCGGDAAAHRGFAVAQGGDRALQRIEQSPVPGGGRVRPDPRERLGAQRFQPGTAVDQQRLADHAGPLALGVRGAVTPPVEDLADPVQRLLDRGRAEDQVGQVHPVEQAHVLEVAEPAELPGQREQQRAHRTLGRSRLGRAELRGAGPDQPRPLPTGPGPVGPVGPRAVRQDQPGGVAAGAAQVGGVLVVQRSPRRVQRLDQPGQRPPVQRVSPRDAHGPVAAQPLPPEREQRRGLAVEQRDPAIPAPVPPKAP